jgi:hypothetical protein
LANSYQCSLSTFLLDALDGIRYIQQWYQVDLKNILSSFNSAQSEAKAFSASATDENVVIDVANQVDGWHLLVLTAACMFSLSAIIKASFKD